MGQRETDGRPGGEAGDRDRGQARQTTECEEEERGAGEGGRGTQWAEKVEKGEGKEK